MNRILLILILVVLFLSGKKLVTTFLVKPSLIENSDDLPAKIYSPSSASSPVQKPAPVHAPSPAPVHAPAFPPARTVEKQFRCDGRKYCSQMRSCEEAMFFLRNCPDVEMDGDYDGIPCEDQWCRH